MLLFVIIALALFVLVDCQTSEDDYCSFDDGTPGVCSIINRCDLVYQQSRVGLQSDKLCGYTESEPVVCCPVEASQTTTETQWTTTISDEQGTIETEGTTQRPINKYDRSIDEGVTLSGNYDKNSHAKPGDLARKMCKEYQKYLLKFSPTVTDNRHPDKMSACHADEATMGSRITGGIKANPKEFPHMVAVGYQKKPKGILWGCGGTLVSKKFVLTAAHCTYHHEFGPAVHARVGDISLITYKANAQTKRISKVIRYSDNKPPKSHDIALLLLNSAVTLNAYVIPACLSPESSQSQVPNAIATGWGIVNAGGDLQSKDLMRVVLDVVKGDACKKIWGDKIDDELHICAGESDKNSCKGDSGGPLVIRSPPEYACMYDLIGVTSFGNQYCGDATPSVFAKVHYYLPWLEKNIWKNGTDN